MMLYIRFKVVSPGLTLFALKIIEMRLLQMNLNVICDHKLPIQRPHRLTQCKTIARYSLFYEILEKEEVLFMRLSKKQIIIVNRGRSIGANANPEFIAFDQPMTDTYCRYLLDDKSPILNIMSCYKSIKYFPVCSDSEL